MANDNNGTAVTDDSMSIDEILATWQPYSVPVTITIDPNADPPRTATFVFTSIGRVAYETLIADHPPTDEQQTRARQSQLAKGTPPSKIQALQWNSDTFPAALLSKCCTSPRMTASQARQLWDDPKRNTGELDRLFSAAVLANEAPAQVRLGKGWNEILDSVST
jgi:hypothetical protein